MRQNNGLNKGVFGARSIIPFNFFPLGYNINEGDGPFHNLLGKLPRQEGVFFMGKIPMPHRQPWEETSILKLLIPAQKVSSYEERIR
jgi:hypothetical protein